ncbi:pyridoxal phosphate-dependent aminotransferase [Anaerophilus nitritogenes]|uniref:pyridoxal phosphate-dependent aminotransferase n=1 Tax=Anaerophilus nitritogenes TaxID=2498136 RepID=UPI00101C0AA7|nr:pyridoxal phosphate-dependent aminotransferase [Anaerophilus nitritogenes]
MKNQFLAKKYHDKMTTPMGVVSELAYLYDDMINLSLGDPDFITDRRIIDKTFEDICTGHTKYTDALGDLELRKAISNFYQNTYSYKVDEKEMMIVVGACHGMHLVLEAILDEGDEIIVPEPYFTPYKNQIELARGKMITLETTEEDHFQINIEKLKEKITNKTKAIIINTPNNPTGATLNFKILKKIAQIVQENNLLIITDEVYGGFSFEEDFTPFTTIEEMKKRTITLGSFSKDYAMTGWRVGYVLASDYIIDCIKDINEGICYCAPSISQRAAIYALNMREEIILPMKEEYRKRVFYAYERINKIPKLSVMKPQGAFYLFVNIKKTGLTSMECSEKLLKEAHILTIPGNAFGKSGENYIRIATTVGIETLKEAFDRIEKIKW